MTRYTKTPVKQLSANESAALQQINKNLDDIQSAIQDTVSRSGQSPTQMTADLDLNGKRIINISAPLTDNDLVRRKDVVEDIAAVQSLVNTASTAAGQAIAAAEGVQEAIADAHVGIVADDLILGDDSKIRIAANNIDDISACVNDITDIKAVGENISNVNSIADNETNINTVAGDLTNIDAVAGDLTNIDVVAGNKTNIDAVAGNTTNINAVNTNKTNIDTVATNISNVNTCAANISDITEKANKSLDNLDAAGQAVIDGKVDLNAANLSTAGKSLISGLGMPSNRYDDLTLGASGSTYTAPANGYFTIAKGINASNQFVVLYNQSNGLRTMQQPGASSGIASCIIPAKTGQSIFCEYSLGGSTLEFKFIYAEGEQ